MATNPALNTLSGSAASRPAASAFYTGLIYYATDTGDVSLCDGTNWVILGRATANGANLSFPLIGSSTATSQVLTGSYARMFQRWMMDFHRFKEARLTAWTSFLALFTGPNAYVKVVDITNSKDMTDVITVTSSTAARYTTAAWHALDAATIANDSEFDLEMFGDNPGDTLKMFFAQLELR